MRKRQMRLACLESPILKARFVMKYRSCGRDSNSQQRTRSTECVGSQKYRGPDDNNINNIKPTSNSNWHNGFYTREQSTIPTSLFSFFNEQNRPNMKDHTRNNSNLKARIIIRNLKKEAGT